MATKGGRADSPLASVLYDEPYRFDFFQAVRVLERLAPERKPVGRSSDPASEVARFRTRASISFPASEIHEINREAASDKGHESPPEVVVSFIGLTGPLGVLPHQYTELLMERARYKDTALWSFIDIFNHRMISLFYRAWEKYRFPIAYERGEVDRFTEFLFDTIGMGTPGLRGDRLNMPDQGLLLYGGLIAQRPHSASAVESILSDYFGAPARIQQFAGQWLNLEPGDYSFVGRANNQLGVNTVVGTRVWDDQSKFRLKFGPVGLREFVAFLPVGSAFKPATSFTRFLVGMEFDFDVQLVLKAEDVPPCELGAKRGSVPPLLGWTTWLKTQPFAADDSQVVLAVNN